MAERKSNPEAQLVAERPGFKEDPSAGAIELQDILPEGVLSAVIDADPLKDVGVAEVAEPYSLAKPGEIVNPERLTRILAEYRLALGMPVRMLAYGNKNKVGAEARPLYFGALLDPNTGELYSGEVVRAADPKDLPLNRIISFGRCNVECPYCKRGMQFVDGDGVPIVVVNVPLSDVCRLGEGAISRAETVRFSGGDPVMFARQVLALARYYYEQHGVKSSIAHNGSGPKWVEELIPYLESAAIDLKAVPEKIAGIMGVAEQRGDYLYGQSLETQEKLSHAGVGLDVRTPIFGDTTVEDMIRLAEDITRANDMRYTFWTWRLYKKVEGCDFVVPEDPEAVIAMMKVVSARFPNLWMGMRAKWSRGGMIFVKGGEVINRTADSGDSFDPEVGLEKVE